jgi:hypothetical protein
MAIQAMSQICHACTWKVKKVYWSLTSIGHALHICDTVQVGHMLSPSVPSVKKNANIVTLWTATPAHADAGLNANDKG